MSEISYDFNNFNLDKDEENPFQLDYLQNSNQNETNDNKIKKQNNNDEKKDIGKQVTQASNDISSDKQATNDSKIVSDSSISSLAGKGVKTLNSFTIPKVQVNASSLLS